MADPGYMLQYQNLKKFAEKQKRPFLAFFGVPLKKIQVAANRTISKLDALPIAHFEADVPDFSKHMLKMAILWVSDPPKVT